VALASAFSLSYVHPNIDAKMLLVRRNCDSVAITRDTRNEDKEKSPAQAHPHLCNIGTTGTKDKTSAPPQVQLSLLRSISLNSGLLARYMMTKVG
jgi:hypothetical protein